jgi:predicted membrane-bound spermidine synthase
MDFIERIPFLSAISAAIVTGIVSKASGVENKHVMMRMLIGAAVFLAAGLYLRHVLLSILEERAAKKRIEDMEKQAALVKEIMEEKKNKVKNKIDYRVDSDEFTPLDMSSSVKAIKK